MSTDETDESTSSTLILASSPQCRCSSPEVEQLGETTESLQNQVRHYKTLQPRPDPISRMFPSSWNLNSKQDGPSSTLMLLRSRTGLPRYFKRIPASENWIILWNSRFIPELKTHWGTFYNKAQLYGVFKKVMKPSLLDKVKHSIAMMKALPDMFPSPVAPPKKLGDASEAMLHILESAEDLNTFLQARPLFSPVVIVCETNCVLAIGTMPVVTFPKEDIYASVTYLMACYYVFHLTYHCIVTLLSVLQTEVLSDAIHDRDMTSSYKKAMAK